MARRLDCFSFRQHRLTPVRVKANIDKKLPPRLPFEIGKNNRFK
jgi:hypothetical protein